MRISLCPPHDRSPTHSPFSSSEMRQSKKMKHNKNGGAKIGTPSRRSTQTREQADEYKRSRLDIISLVTVSLTPTVHFQFTGINSESISCLVLPLPPPFYFFLFRPGWKNSMTFFHTYLVADNLFAHSPCQAASFELKAISCLKRYKHSPTKHLLNAAKSLIPGLWNMSLSPSISEWLQKISEIYEMEDTLAQSNELVEMFHKTWQPWIVFRYSKAFSNITGDLMPRNEIHP